VKSNNLPSFLDPSICYEWLPCSALFDCGWAGFLAAFRSHRGLPLENLALRQQLIVLKRKLPSGAHGMTLSMLPTSSGRASIMGNNRAMKIRLRNVLSGGTGAVHRNYEEQYDQDPCPALPGGRRLVCAEQNATRKSHWLTLPCLLASRIKASSQEYLDDTRVSRPGLSVRFRD
jgi:hypothetical protein